MHIASKDVKNSDELPPIGWYVTAMGEFEYLIRQKRMRNGERTGEKRRKKAVGQPKLCMGK